MLNNNYIFSFISPLHPFLCIILAFSTSENYTSNKSRHNEGELFLIFWCLFLVHTESRWLIVMVLWSTLGYLLVQERERRRKVLAARIPQAKSTSRRVSHSTWGKQAECSSSLSFITWERLMADGMRVHSSPVGHGKEARSLIVLYKNTIKKKWLESK